jgi:hypothetical protein
MATPMAQPSPEKKDAEKRETASTRLFKQDEVQHDAMRIVARRLRAHASTWKELSSR